MKGVRMKNLFLVFLAMLMVGCATVAPRKCGDLVKAVGADHDKAGHMMIQAGRDPDGTTAAVYYDVATKIVYLEILTPVAENAKTLESKGFSKKEQCVVDNKPESVYTYYNKTMQVQNN